MSLQLVCNNSPEFDGGGPEGPDVSVYGCPDCDGDSFMIYTTGEICCYTCGADVELVLAE